MLLLVLLLATLQLHAQISVSFTDSKKASYKMGEIVRVRILLKSLPETCIDGMKQTKIFLSNLDIESQTAWKQLTKGTFQKELTLKILSVKKKVSKLTILRKVDKENLFYQETFPITSN